jgi:hypothetical protein
MLWLLVLSVLVLKVAVVTPPLVERLPLPIEVLPSEKVTVPVGLATTVLPGAFTLTVAVKVTDWPDTEGLTALLSKVVVSALLTTWLTAAEVEPLKLVSLL